jgi:hypothetical protein
MHVQWRARGSARAQGDYHGQRRGWARQGRRGGERGGARVDAMGGGELGIRGRLSSARASAAGENHARGGQRGGVPLRCDRERDLPSHGEAAEVRVVLNAAASPTQEERGIKIQSCPRDRCVHVLGCTMAWGIGSARVNANVNTNGSARRRGRERQGTTINSDKVRLGQESERASTKAAAPATASLAAARSDCTFHLGSKAGASKWAGKRSSSPWWPRAEVQASVQ